jgi:hypothetical protein
LPDPIVSGLWVELLGRIAAPAAHAVNNALNNVAINLAVVQSRPDARAYAERADEYLTEATRLMQGVLSLARAVPSPAEPASLVHQLVLVIQAGGRHIHIVEEPGPIAKTALDGGAVRLALAAALADEGVHIVRIAGEQVHIEGAVLPADVADAAKRAGIALRVESRQVTFTFSGVAIPA